MAQQVCCCTCARLVPTPSLPAPVRNSNSKSEKRPPSSSPAPAAAARVLPCCSRAICKACQVDNPRFTTYCPFCQISTGAVGALPAEGLRLPPAYIVGTGGGTTGIIVEEADNKQPPPYSPRPPPAERERDGEREREVIHHLSAQDSIASLSLQYGVPTSVLRQHNRLATDWLLAGRKTVGIPRSHYPSGPSLSARASESAADREAEERKNRLRRWMVATKCAEYDVGLVYLAAHGYSLERAIEAYRADERWERENASPFGNGSNKSVRSGRRLRRV